MNTIEFVIFLGITLGLASPRHIHFDEMFPKIKLAEMNFKMKNENPKTCTTPICSKAAQGILDSINPLVDPCEDFYSYACGKWMENHPVPPTENHWNQFQILDKKLDSQIHELLQEKCDTEDPHVVKMAKKVYQACMNTDRIEKRGLDPLIKLLQQFNDWPVTTRKWSSEKFDWQKLSTEVGKKLAVYPILLIYVDADRKNTSRKVLTIDEPNLALPRYMLTQSDPASIEPYATFIAEAADAIAKAKGESIHPFNIVLQSFQIIKFEMKLAKIMREEGERRNAEDLYHLVTIQKLQEWTNERTLMYPNSRINWKLLLSNYLGSEGAKVTNETPIVVTDWNFLENLMTLIDETPSKVLANYIIWRVVNDMSKDLNQEMQKLHFNFKSQLSSIQEDHPRWRDCVHSSGYLPFVVGYMYVKRHFSDEARAKAVEMVEDIKSGFKAELTEVSWMDDETKNQALEKADFMNQFIGYPNWFSNISHLENYYSGVTIGDDHFENKVRLRGFIASKVIDKLNSETNRDEWVASPAIANAFYNPLLNSIIFPAGVLQDPFFNKDQPEALNYGSIGAVVGHEITHGFDYMGRQSDKFGNIKQWWSKETEYTYLKNALCFTNQYENYRVPELDAILETKVTMNGILTLDENIADNGGIGAALRAYQTFKNRSRGRETVLPGLEGFSSEQLFYIGFARVWCESHTPASLLGEVLGDPHAPHKFRVIGSLSNSEHFASTWRCKLGSNMNPEKKCKLW